MSLFMQNMSSGLHWKCCQARINYVSQNRLTMIFILFLIRRHCGCDLSGQILSDKKVKIKLKFQEYPSMQSQNKKGNFKTFQMNCSHVQVYHYISIFIFCTLDNNLIEHETTDWNTLTCISSLVHEHPFFKVSVFTVTFCDIYIDLHVYMGL